MKSAAVLLLSQLDGIMGRADSKAISLLGHGVGTLKMV